MVTRLGPLRVDIEWRTGLLVAVLLPLLLALGFWQLEREREKREIARRFAARQAAAPVPLAPALATRGDHALAYLPVRLSGRYLPARYLLLDNRMREGRFGYEVVSLFALGGGAGYALVNRGWVPADPARRTLPAVPAPAGPVTLRGHLYVPPDPPYLLGEQSFRLDDWPRVLQALEPARLTAALAEHLDAPVFPWSVRVDAAAPGAFAVDWQVINVRPEKHRAYAVQWFAMAAVLALFFLLRSSNLAALLRPSRREGGEP